MTVYKFSGDDKIVVTDGFSVSDFPDGIYSVYEISGERSVYLFDGRVHRGKWFFLDTASIPVETLSKATRLATWLGFGYEVTAFCNPDQPCFVDFVPDNGWRYIRNHCDVEYFPSGDYWLVDRVLKVKVRNYTVIGVCSIDTPIGGLAAFRISDIARTVGWPVDFSMSDRGVCLSFDNGLSALKNAYDVTIINNDFEVRTRSGYHLVYGKLKNGAIISVLSKEIQSLGLMGLLRSMADVAGWNMVVECGKDYGFAVSFKLKG